MPKGKQYNSAPERGVDTKAAPFGGGRGGGSMKSGGRANRSKRVKAASTRKGAGHGY